MPIGLGITIAVGTVIDVVGRIKAGNAAKRAGEYNQQVSEQLAQDALDKGKTDEEMYRQGVRGLIGTQRADFAGQNVDVQSGSAQDVYADTAYLGELDAQQIRLNAQREAWGYRVQGQQAVNQGNAQATADYYGAAGSAIGGAANILGLKYGFGGRSSTRPSTAPGRAGSPARFS